MFTFDKLELPRLGLRGLESGLSEEEEAIQGATHRFAEEVMRPIGKKLDAMAPAEVIAEGSPLHDYMAQINAAGILDLGALAEMTNEQKARVFPLIFEELGWGDSGLAIATLASSIPAFTAHTTGDSEIIERFGNLPGCWLATQPERGSDVVDMDATEVHANTQQSKGNLLARRDGEEYVINGQSAAWVSYAPLAQTAMAYLPCDYGDGFYKEGQQGMHHVGILIPLDLPGVSRGKPLDKLGQRPLPQGEVFFDEVRVPAKYAIATGDAAIPQMMATLTFANMEMAATFTGVARSAFDLALDYVHERKQGGTAIINHQTVQARTFDLWQRVEASRALTHRVFNYNYGEFGPHLLGSVTSKTFATRTSFEVASEALQLFGGNGLTKEYLIEKIMRDARASMIEDGENNVLNLKGMRWLSKWYQDKHGVSV
ncbi:MAG: acyl-CoA dehydrogenase [Gammaproteobacteria bacterium]|nr:MAG: acyl-CoA dehydrogenase [Gammaproteobacteria bacterium]RLA56981.1 MAG: acyl-CoA dehydrogenase [Gammaproteobacteria bacterium]